MGTFWQEEEKLLVTRLVPLAWTQAKRSQQGVSQQCAMGTGAMGLKKEQRNFTSDNAKDIYSKKTFISAIFFVLPSSIDRQGDRENAPGKSGGRNRVIVLTHAM